MQGTYFNLAEGERIVQEIKPEYNLRIYYFLGMFLPLLPVFAIVAFYALMLASTPKVFGMQVIFSNSLYALIAIFLLAVWLLSGNKYSHEFYWITNKRIVYKRGMLGYRITSIPYERVSDVMISKTFTERIFGIASLHIQSLAGQVTNPWQGTGLGAEGSLNAIPNPEETQELIFKLIKEKRKEEHLSF